MQQSPPSLSAGEVLPVGRPEPGTVAICFVAAALESVRARHMDTREPRPALACPDRPDVLGAKR